MKLSRRLSALSLLGLAAALSPNGASAADKDTLPRKVGDWTLAISEDGDGCFLTRIYDRPGDTTLLLGLDRDGSNHLTVLNANWSIKPKERLALDFRLTSGGYPKHFAIGLGADGKQGFVTSFERAFPTYLAKSQRLDIARGDVPVERLSLDGSGAAIAALRNCVAARKVVPAKASRDQGGADGIPRDPFAKRVSRKR
ncbi:hypothetical protein [Sphingomonas sanguinis]|jgi:hypothetical protein|uniref:Uncharacterized protein n=1 Tax=Sphingomonas sanguinis TaxID=33051 RepID=A0A7Y7QVT1_9SPHN|nr:hypothetical protein [Sphingomonas sanguinis]MBZ6382312.1 hypothetical protein [Sphingomonas sanguinis]NNG50898.1 hypothetical protein [Sphingomonas sanguinis]NNG54314.1 hypothetical protein [Sphingomonas sanguinis]NVP31610.1 hypothetical protein [Sphingomonas sanguinis]